MSSVDDAAPETLDANAVRRHIHQSRTRIGERRQTHCSTTLREIVDLLEQERIDHPYELREKDFLKIKRQSWFRAPPSGPLAECPETGYLYRLTDVTSVAAAVRWTAPDSLSVDTAGSLWSEFLAESKRRGSDRAAGWVPLRRFATGSYAGLRGFSWWTTLADITDDVIRANYRLGRPTNHIARHTLVLRTAAREVRTERTARVPSVIEAFDSPIFYTTREADQPRYGITITLENSPALSEGVDEYVLGPIPVERIEAFPVLVDESAWAAYREGSDHCSLALPLYQALLSFYRGLED